MLIFLNISFYKNNKVLFDFRKRKELEMIEISTVQVVPQMKVVKIANSENTGKAYLLNEPINDTVVIAQNEKKGGGVGRGI